MTWLDKLERKFSKYAIKNITLVLIGCYGIGYLMYLLSPNLLSLFNLDPYMILKGQIWRLFTWIVSPPAGYTSSPMSFFFLLLMMYFYYFVGNVLENTWGTFRFNIYLLSGMLFTVAGVFLLYLLVVIGILRPADLNLSVVSTYYVNLSLFLAYAAIFPEMRILFMFIIPIKIKWLGIAYSVFLAIRIFSPESSFSEKIIIITSVLNFIIFFLSTRNLKRMAPQQIKRRQNFKKQVKKNAPHIVAKHRCATCGETNDNPALEFRFCSRCNGHYEYCQNHLFTHEHIK